MLYGPDAAFEDHEHELYDLQEDPHELVNLAHDPARRAELRRRFDDLLALEAGEFVIR
jgi:arylsulfatase A-like enzyme